mgnify:CR=1 FL=1
MPQVVLNRSRIMAVVRQLVAAAVPQHMGMDRKTHRQFLPRPCQQLPKPRRCDRSPTLARKHIRSTGRSLSLQLPQRPQFWTPQVMDARRSLLNPVYLKPSLFQIHLIPAKRHQLRHPEAVPVRQEDHGRIPMAVASPRLGRLHEFLHFPFGQVLPAAAITVRHPPRRSGGSYCPIYRYWRVFWRCRFHAGFIQGEGGLLSQ